MSEEEKTVTINLAADLASPGRVVKDALEKYERLTGERLAAPACPAWADGQHYYEAYYEHPGLNDGDSKVFSKHGPGRAAYKRCKCGHEVKST